MCGFVGIFNSKEAVNNGLLIKMRDCLTHRGPDDAGIFTDNNIGLAHRRLSIIDLSENARQPMANEDETLQLVFNGEIYNYVELADELKKRGHRFRTSSDSEVILHLYEEKGDKCLADLNGMFAFAIWDKKQHTLFAARDRMGIKPFYYYLDSNRFIFGSEIKAIIEDRSVPRKPDYKAIADYIAFLYSADDKTFFEGIKALPPGHCLTIGREMRLQTRQYWDVRFEYKRNKDEKWFVKNLYDLLDDAVRIHLRSDVPLGCHLSGGLDSSTVTCLAGKRLDKIKTFSGKFDEGDFYDETHYAKIAAAKAGAEYLETTPSGSDFAEVFKKMVRHMDSPAVGPGIFPQYYVCSLAAKNVKVALGGQGGDELFGGYEKYFWAYQRLEDKYKTPGLTVPVKAKESLKELTKAILGRKSHHPGRETRDLAGLWLHYNYFTSPASRLFSPLAEKTKGYDISENFLRHLKKENGAEPIDRMLYHDQKSYLGALLQVEDRTSMSVSLESRVPLLDYRIVEFAATIPPEIKFAGGTPKSVLKKAVAGLLPEEILARKDKRGFPTPVDIWFKGSQKDFVQSTLLSQKAKERGIFDPKDAEALIAAPTPSNSWAIWAMLNVEYWFRTFID